MEKKYEQKDSQKKYKKTLDIMLHGREKGISVTIKNHGFVDEHGKECEPLETVGARYIQFKRPKIQYFKK